jgi:two-component system, chemotaxis family, chemotaxis protein CheY
MAKSVLIVDDIPFVRKVLSDLLGELGYSVVGEASNGREACDKYMQLTPDLVTMDIVMPIMSGIEATKNILKQNRDAIVIMITGMDQEHFMMEAIQAGAKDILIKPFQAKEVERILNRALGKDSGSSQARAGAV